MSFFKACKKAQNFTATHLAAVNGCNNYLQNWLGRSQVVQMENKTIVAFKNPTDKSQFVYGGNTALYGSYELRHARLLSNFKKFEDSNVTLLVGQADLKHLELLNNRSNYLDKITLSHFEHRRSEVAAESGINAFQVCNSDVISSFEKEMMPKGVIANYLKSTQLCTFIGDTLFIHGGITKENMGLIPGSFGERNRFKNARIWINAINDWYQKQMHNIFSDGSNAQFSLLNMYNDVIANPRSIINSRINPLRMDPEVIDYLNDAGITRVIMGSNPRTFNSNLIPIIQDNFTLVIGDTNFSDRKDSNEFRGWFLHNLDITYEDGRSRLHFDVINKQGNRQTFSLEPARLLELTDGGPRAKF